FCEMISPLLYLIFLVLMSGNPAGASAVSQTDLDALPPPLPAVVNEPLCKNCHATEPLSPPAELASNPECLKCHNAGVVPAGSIFVKSPVGNDLRRMRSSKQKAVPNRMILIPAGTFVMGDDAFKKAVRPHHEVYLEAFYIDSYDVTNLHYKEFLDATG